MAAIVPLSSATNKLQPCSISRPLRARRFASKKFAGFREPGRHPEAGDLVIFVGWAGRMTGADMALIGPRADQVRRARGVAAACPVRTLPADRHTTSEICISCRASGLVLRQTMPMVREGCGSPKRETETEADRVSTGTAISGIKVTPMPALTI